MRQVQRTYQVTSNTKDRWGFFENADLAATLVDTIVHYRDDEIPLHFSA